MRGGHREQYRDRDAAELDRIARDLRVSMALSAPGSPAQLPLKTNLDAVTSELARRAGGDD
jgi:hypothetical protein